MRPVCDLHGILTDDDAAYIGFVGHEGEERVRAAYPGDTWDRLREVKAKYDPGQPVPPQPEHPPAQ